MKNAAKLIAALRGLLMLGLSWPAWQLYGEIQKSRSEDPLVWGEAITDLEAKTKGKYGPGQGVVFIGSSSNRLWHRLTDDMSPMPVIQHGYRIWRDIIRQRLRDELGDF